MRLLLLIILVFPLAIISQNNSRDRINNQNGIDRENYLGNGIYEIIRVQGRKCSSGKEEFLFEQANKKADDLIIQYSASSYKLISKNFEKIIHLEKKKRLIRLKIQLINSNREPLLRKDEAKKKILELKKLKNEGIISDSDYRKSIEPYKKILLEP